MKLLEAIKALDSSKVERVTVYVAATREYGFTLEVPKQKALKQMIAIYKHHFESGGTDSNVPEAEANIVKLRSGERIMQLGKHGI